LVFLEKRGRGIAPEVRKGAGDILASAGDFGSVEARCRGRRKSVRKFEPSLGYFWILEVFELGWLCAIDADMLAGIERRQAHMGCGKTDGLKCRGRSSGAASRGRTCPGACKQRRRTLARK